MRLNPDLLRLIPDAQSRVDELVTRAAQAADMANAHIVVLQLPGIDSMGCNLYKLAVYTPTSYRVEEISTYRGTIYAQSYVSRGALARIQAMIETVVGGAIVPIALLGAHADKRDRDIAAYEARVRGWRVQNA